MEKRKVRAALGCLKWHFCFGISKTKAETCARSLACARAQATHVGDVMRDAVTVNEDISLSTAADLIVQKKANRLVGHLCLFLYPLLVHLLVWNMFTASFRPSVLNSDAQLL